MKVAYFTHYSEMYGANQSLFSLVLQLRYKGIEPVVICPSQGPLTDKLEETGINVLIIPFRPWASKNKSRFKKSVKRLYNQNAARKITKVLRKLNIDLVHTNSSVISIGAMAAKLLKLPHVWHIREMLEEDYNISFENGYSESVRYINNSSSKVICISEAVFSKYKNDIDHDRITVIYNGIDENNIIYNDENRPNVSENINLLITGILVKEKGQAEAIRALAVLNYTYNMNCRLNIVGDGPELEFLKEIALQLGVIDRVKFHGFITGSQMDEIRKESEVALVCSHCEAFGRVTVEAMLAGIPVIGANTGGTVELIKDEVNGLLYNLGDPQHLALQVRKLVTNQELYASVKVNARTRSLKEFTAHRNSTQIMSVYKSIVQTNNSERS
ncbi:glycosyltransferase family 4 protein [Paenibacillus sp. OV219]|uniref:glycosyltransferase family 4 protein n=1 Tax=Paenibacillus sp. OV219 TaxID=1884377 RepID=UPI0008C3FBC9|nr:glycosyltransferase family 4 protein [Paenibacillus sp. OV219]SEN61509.1 Glycosyltransferase involved in cell wall bisynthesis [Paenibacillus sp. OV219]